MPDTKLQPLPEDWNTALAIAAHPDDLEYGTASAVARWTSQGKKVSYLMVTRGEAGIDAMSPAEAGPLREEEERQSAAEVGVETVEFLGYTDGVIEYGLDLRRDIARAIRRHKPDVIITGNFQVRWAGGGFNMADHRAVGHATLDAARDAGNRWIFPELLEEGHEPWNGVKSILVGGSPDATHAVDVTDFIDKGVASLEKHRAYIDNLAQDFDPESYLTFIGAAIGANFDCDYAVSFEVF
ncbi:MAG: PIG-L family deacetylase [Chloroflexi bacterium]|nr:PIG-L family deacetylase [Chloroflexota bacterium]MDA1228502.1 PIG-L family deacetylase [Chloroflexota bacterium]